MVMMKNVHVAGNLGIIDQFQQECVTKSILIQIYTHNIFLLLPTRFKRPLKSFLFFYFYHKCGHHIYPLLPLLDLQLIESVAMAVTATWLATVRMSVRTTSRKLTENALDGSELYHRPNFFQGHCRTILFPFLGGHCFHFVLK